METSAPPSPGRPEPSGSDPALFGNPGASRCRRIAALGTRGSAFAASALGDDRRDAGFRRAADARVPTPVCPREPPFPSLVVRLGARADLCLGVSLGILAG